MFVAYSPIIVKVASSYNQVMLLERDSVINLLYSQLFKEVASPRRHSLIYDDSPIASVEREIRRPSARSMTYIRSASSEHS